MINSYGFIIRRFRNVKIMIIIYTVEILACAYDDAMKEGSWWWSELNTTPVGGTRRQEGYTQRPDYPHHFWQTDCSTCAAIGDDVLIHFWFDHHYCNHFSGLDFVKILN